MINMNIKYDQKDVIFDKSYPIFYRSKEECCGCAACFSACSQGAISMVPDEEGFEYPVLKENKCIQCFACIRVCPFKEY